MAKTWMGAVLAAAVVLAGCGDDDEGGGSRLRGACNDVEASGSCLEVFGSFSSSDMAELETECENSGGTFSTTPCPSADRSGTCTLDLSGEAGAPDDARLREHYYGLSEEDENMAEAFCVLVDGDWQG